MKTHEEEIYEKLASIDATVKQLADNYPQLRDKLEKVAEETTKAMQSVKSAHHRIDDLKSAICWTLATSVTVVGIFASILTTILKS